MRFLAGILACGVLVCTTPARAQNAALLGVAEVSLLLDLSTTLDIKNHYQLHEMNPILGRHPSDLSVVAYFAVVMGGTAVGYHLLPREARPYAMGAIVALEAFCIHRNVRNGLSLTLPF